MCDTAVNNIDGVYHDFQCKVDPVSGSGAKDFEIYWFCKGSPSHNQYAAFEVIGVYQNGTIMIYQNFNQTFTIDDKENTNLTTWLSCIAVVVTVVSTVIGLILN